MDAFLAAFLAGTQPHPFVRWLRVWENRACFEVKAWDGRMWLDYITSLERGQGDGSAALKWFLALADEHKVTIHGHLKRVGDSGLTEAQLRAWYVRHGFKVDKYSNMVRKSA